MTISYPVNVSVWHSCRITIDTQFYYIYKNTLIHLLTLGLKPKDAIIRGLSCRKHSHMVWDLPNFFPFCRHQNTAAVNCTRAIVLTSGQSTIQPIRRHQRSTTMFLKGSWTSLGYYKTPCLHPSFISSKFCACSLMKKEQGLVGQPRWGHHLATS